MVQEAAHNAMRHGHATIITITITFSPADIRVQIVDNGCGFNPEQVDGPQLGHFGLQSLRERARKIVASVTIESSSTTGSTITVTIPGTSL
jgi:signal transduction histidine kinase